MHDEGDARPWPTATGAARPPTVLVCETSAGAFVLHGMPDGPMAYVEPDDAADLGLALDAAFTASPRAAGVEAFHPADWFEARPGDRPIDRWEADVPASGRPPGTALDVGGVGGRVGRHRESDAAEPPPS